MADVPNTVNQQAQTPEEVCQQMLAYLDASKEIVGELSDQELEAVSGGGAGELIMTFTSMMGGGGGPGGGTGTGSTAANQHMTGITNTNSSAAQSSNGNINFGNIRG